MANKLKTRHADNLKDPEKYLVAGPGGATRQTAKGDEGSLTTNQGVVIADSQNTPQPGDRSPSLLFRKKITHFDQVIGHTSAALPLFVKASLSDELDEGVVDLEARSSVGEYIDAPKSQRVWAREA
jgi:hypothetical protein